MGSVDRKSRMLPKREAKVASATGGGSAAGPAPDVRSAPAATTTRDGHVACASSASAPSNPGFASPLPSRKEEIGAVVASDARSAAMTAPETALASFSNVDRTTPPADDSGSPFSPTQSSAQSPRTPGLPLATPGGALVFSNVLGGACAAPARPSETYALPQTQPDLVQALQLVLDRLSDISSWLVKLETRSAPSATIAPHEQGGGDGVAQGGPPGGIFAAGHDALPALPGVSGGSTPTPGAAVLVGHGSDATRDMIDGAVSGSLFLPPHSSANGGVVASVPDPQSHGLARRGDLSTPFDQRRPSLPVACFRLRPQRWWRRCRVLLLHILVNSPSPAVLCTLRPSMLRFPCCNCDALHMMQWPSGWTRSSHTFSRGCFLC